MIQNTAVMPRYLREKTAESMKSVTEELFSLAIAQLSNNLENLVHRFFTGQIASENTSSTESDLEKALNLSEVKLEPSQDLIAQLKMDIESLTEEKHSVEQYQRELSEIGRV